MAAGPGIRHRRRMEYAPGHRLWSNCEHCGKRTFEKKAHAKLARKQVRDAPRGVYLCESGSGWHFGRLPTAVKTGDATRHEHYGDVA